MKFKALTYFGEKHFFNGIYKLSSYTRDNNNLICKKYYRAYYMLDGVANWGNHVDGDKKYTVSEAAAACREHALHHHPSSKTLARAEAIYNSLMQKHD